MSFFGDSPEDWQRLDWYILRDGGIHLYWRLEYLQEDQQWLADHEYDVYQFGCETWVTPEAMFSDFARVLHLPEYFGSNFDALDDCISDLPLTPSRGAVLVMTRFDAYATGSGTLPNVRPEAEWILDIIAKASYFHLLNGKRLLALVQSNDPKLSLWAVGSRVPQWNRREWLDAKRQ